MNEENETQETPEIRQIELSHFATITLRGDGTGSIEGPLIDERPDGWEEDPVHVAIDNLFGLALLHALAGVERFSQPAGVFVRRAVPSVSRTRPD